MKSNWCKKQGSSNRAANCAAAGRPGGTDATINPNTPGNPPPNPAGPYDFRYDSSLEIRSGGNPTLEAETSDSWTLGTVVTPAFLPGFSLSVDYYNIKVDKVIGNIPPSLAVSQCVFNNQFCQLLQALRFAIDLRIYV